MLIAGVFLHFSNSSFLVYLYHFVADWHGSKFWGGNTALPGATDIILEATDIGFNNLQDLRNSCSIFLITETTAGVNM